MKESELMIGNIVGYSSLTRMITAINPPYFVDLGNGERTTITNVCIEHLNPIPITEELLLKNGFKHEYDEICEFNCYIKKIEDCYVDVQIECANKGNDYVVCHIDNADRCTIASADIQYVHQMQSLLNIMDIKWEVNI